MPSFTNEFLKDIKQNSMHSNLDIQHAGGVGGPLRPPSQPMIFESYQPGNGFGFQPVQHMLPTINANGLQNQFQIWQQFAQITQEQQGQQFLQVRGQRGRGNLPGRIGKGKWLEQRRRGNSHGFNGYNQSRTQQSFYYNFEYQNGDFQRRKWNQRGSRGRFLGGRHKGKQDQSNPININATCNITFLDSTEASNSMKDVGERMAQQIVQQIRASCNNGIKPLKDMPQIQVNINLQNNDTVADNMQKADVQKFHISSNAFQMSSYEPQCRPNRQAAINCTPSTVQQGCASQREEECISMCQVVPHQPYVLSGVEGLSDMEVLRLAKQKLPGFIAYSPEYLEEQDLTWLQALCADYQLLNDAPGLDLSKLELIDLLNEHFANLDFLCSCPHNYVEHISEVKSLPCGHTLCATCFASYVHVSREGDEARILCTTCDVPHEGEKGGSDQVAMELDQQGECGDDMQQVQGQVEECMLNEERDELQQQQEEIGICSPSFQHQ